MSPMWNGMKKPKRVMNNKQVKTLKAGISRLQPWRMSSIDVLSAGSIVNLAG